MTNNNKFSGILNDAELSNIETVKSYLQFSFRSRKPKKDYKLYINICKICELYPETIRELLNNIPTLGYYKDYFYILMFSRNAMLDSYIYDLIYRQLLSDVRNMKESKQITTLGKWLPRENSKINLKCNFIDKFSQMFFTEVRDVNNGRKRYRKLKTALNKYLGTLESKICTKKYDEIDFSKVSHNSLKNNKEHLLKHDEVKEKLNEFEMSFLKKLHLSGFIKELYNNNYSAEMLLAVWEHNRYRMDIPYIDKIIANSTCIIDLSKDTFNENAEHFAIGMALLTDTFSLNEQKVIVCKDNKLKLTGNLIDKANYIMQNIGPCREIDIEKYLDILEPNCKNLIIVSNKDIVNCKMLAEKQITLLQFMPTYDSYDIVHFAGDKIRKFKKYVSKFESNAVENGTAEIFEVAKDINIIVENSCEFKDKRVIYFVMLMVAFWFVVRMLEFIY